MDDAFLLKQYVADRSHAAFAALVDRYGNLVHAAARRHVSDRHLVEDIVQGVFVVLAQKAATIPPGRSVGAWLLTTTRFIALNERRLRRRAAQRERRIADMNGLNLASAPAATGANPATALEWASLGALLDEGLAKLSARDRDVLVLRYFEAEPLGAIAQRTGVSEEAARKRVSRALDRLRDYFRRRGAVAEDVTPALAVLGIAASPPLSAALREAIMQSALTPLEASSAILGKGALILMAAQKAKVVVAIVVGALLLGGGVIGGFAVLRGPARPRTMNVSVSPSGGAAPAASAGIAPLAASSAAHPAVTFADGTVVRLAGVRHYLGRAWWGADGSGVQVPELEIPHSIGASEPNGRRAIEVRVRADGSTSLSRDARLRLGGIPGSGAWHVAFDGERAVILSSIFSLPGDMAETTVDYGLATGPWRTFDSLTPAAAATRPAATTRFVQPQHGADGFPIPSPPGLPPLRIRSMTEADGKTRVEFVDINYWEESKETVWRGVVITRDGETRRIVDAEDPDGRIVFIYDVPLKDVARAEYQVRDVDWKSLGPVRTYPTTEAATTSTQLPAAPGPNLPGPNLQ